MSVMASRSLSATIEPRTLQAAMGKAWPARTEQLDGLGHSPNVDDPKALVDALLRGW